MENRENKPIDPLPTIIFTRHTLTYQKTYIHTQLHKISNNDYHETV